MVLISAATFLTARRTFDWSEEELPSRLPMQHRVFRKGMSRLAVMILIVVAVAILIVGFVGAVVFGAVVKPTLSAMSEAEIMAMETKSETQVTMIVQAVQFARGEAPAAEITFSYLLEEAFLIEDLLQSPFGPVSDGRGDFWLHPSPAAFGAVTDPSSYVVAYDRAMCENHSTVAVGYLDDSCRTVTVEEFKKQVNSPPNGNTDYDLPPAK
ncbi:MAG: hypothetical protein ACYS0G_15760 [Planctomycetota bacterium]|jgi:hypothetical protein